jgi:quinol monooxygenase YgiN
MATCEEGQARADSTCQQLRAEQRRGFGDWHAMGKIVSILKFSVAPARLEEFLALMRIEAPRTRAFDGRLAFDIGRADDGKIVFVEHWESQAKADLYGKWRTETGGMALLGGFMTAAPESSTYQATGL